MTNLRVVINEILKEKKDVLLSVLFGFIAGMAAIGFIFSEWLFTIQSRNWRTAYSINCSNCNRQIARSDKSV